MNHTSQLTNEHWGDLSACVKQLCRVYWGPSEALCQEVVEDSFLQPFEALAPLVGANADADLTALRTLLDGFSGAESLLANLETGYVRLFVNDRGGVAAPLYASCYEDQEKPQLMGAPAVRMQRLLADLKLQIGDEVCEPPDHLAIELEVLYFLLTREIAAGRPTVLAVAADFVAGEMLLWVQAFQRRLAGEAQCRFYPLITNILLSVLRLIGKYSDPGLGQAMQ